jgi:hypothetical protein
MIRSAIFKISSIQWITIIGNSKMYTKNELIKDIFEVEGIKITLDSIPDEIRFLTKYSEHYGKQISSYSDMSDIADRVETFIEADLLIKDNLINEFLIGKKGTVDREAPKSNKYIPIIIGVLSCAVSVLLTIVILK